MLTTKAVAKQSHHMSVRASKAVAKQSHHMSVRASKAIAKQSQQTCVDNFAHDLITYSHVVYLSRCAVLSRPTQSKFCIHSFFCLLTSPYRPSFDYPTMCVPKDITTSVATARAVESQLSGRCALNKLGKIMKILVELE